MSRFFRPSTRVLLALLVAGCALLPALARAQDADDDTDDDALRRTISVSGEGTVRATPDRATVRFGVVTEAEEAEPARAQNAAAAKKALNAARALGIPENKIRLETLRLQPRYEYDEDRRSREQVGFQAIREVSVEVDSVDLVPTLVTRVVQQGANTLNGIQYDLQDRTAARNEALQEAATDAQGKADLLAEALGATRGAVLQINEQSFDFPRPMMRMDMEMAARTQAAAAPEPEAYAAGEIEVTATVQLVFVLEDQ